MNCPPRFKPCQPWLTIIAVLYLSTLCAAQAPEIPKPSKHHELLNQFAGEWNVVAETCPAPGQDLIKCEGTESSKMVGGFWLVANGQASMAGTLMSSQLTIGYDPQASKYVGTFLCSMDSTLWRYAGLMDESGKKLTLETSGPSPLDRSKTANFREILELKDKDHKVFTSLMQDDKGEWIKFMTMEYHRKK